MKNCNDLINRGLSVAINLVDKVDRMKGLTLQDVIDIMPILENVWDKKTLRGLLDGQVILTDEAINSSLVLVRKKSDREEVGDIAVTSLPDDQLQLDFATTKWGNIRLHCRIMSLKHNDVESFLVIKLLGKKLLDKPMLSWIFSMISLSIFNKIFGDIELGEGLEVDIVGNVMKIDFRQRLLASQAGKIKVGGFSLLDTVVVKDLKTYDGHVVLQAGLNKK